MDKMREMLTIPEGKGASFMKNELQEGSRVCSRRNILTGTAVLLAGGIMGRINTAFGAAKTTADKAPPLPWKWVKLDAMEAGRRAYHAYLKEGG